jgi:hypothetical protein
MFLKDGIFLFTDYYYLDTEIECLGSDLRTEVDTALTAVILGDLSLRDANTCIVAIIVKENEEYAKRIGCVGFRFCRMQLPSRRFAEDGYASRSELSTWLGNIPKRTIRLG